MNGMTTNQLRPVRRICPKPQPLLLLPLWKVKAVTVADVRAGRLRALVAAQRNRAPAYADEGFRARVESIAARHVTASSI
jgi:hypothetical protein